MPPDDVDAHTWADHPAKFSSYDDFCKAMKEVFIRKPPNTYIAVPRKSIYLLGGAGKNGRSKLSRYISFATSRDEYDAFGRHGSGPV